MKIARNQVFSGYVRFLEGIENLATPAYRTYTDPIWHLFPIRVKKKCRANIYQQLRNAGFGVQVNYLPAHLHPVFMGEGFKWGSFPNSESYYEQEISLPMWPGIVNLGENYFKTIASVLSKYN